MPVVPAGMKAYGIKRKNTASGRGYKYADASTGRKLQKRGAKFKKLAKAHGVTVNKQIYARQAQLDAERASAARKKQAVRRNKAIARTRKGRRKAA